MEDKKLELVFAPGCFDSFEGTQEELDELVQEIQRMFDSGEFMEKSEPVNLDELDDEILEALVSEIDMEPRKLN
jgi:hypothetical protein